MNASVKIDGLLGSHCERITFRLCKPSVVFVNDKNTCVFLGVTIKLATPILFSGSYTKLFMKAPEFPSSKLTRGKLFEFNETWYVPFIGVLSSIHKITPKSVLG